MVKNILNYKPIIRNENERGRQEICAISVMYKSTVMWRDIVLCGTVIKII